MSKLRAIIKHYNEKGTSFALADAMIEASFDNRERFEDDSLDTTSLQCAYLDGIARSGWTQVDYEYVFKRVDETFNEVEYLKENENEQRECEEYEQQEEGGHGQCDPAGCLGHSEAGGGSVGACKGLTGSVDFFDAQPCAVGSSRDSEHQSEDEDSGCTTHHEEVR